MNVFVLMGNLVLEVFETKELALASIQATYPDHKGCTGTDYHRE